MMVTFTCQVWMDERVYNNTGRAAVNSVLFVVHFKTMQMDRVSKNIQLSLFAEDPTDVKMAAKKQEQKMYKAGRVSPRKMVYVN